MELRDRLPTMESGRSVELSFKRHTVQRTTSTASGPERGKGQTEGARGSDTEKQHACCQVRRIGRKREKRRKDAVVCCWRVCRQRGRTAWHGMKWLVHVQQPFTRSPRGDSLLPSQAIAPQCLPMPPLGLTQS